MARKRTEAFSDQILAKNARKTVEAMFRQNLQDRKRKKKRRKKFESNLS